MINTSIVSAAGTLNLPTPSLPPKAASAPVAVPAPQPVVTVQAAPTAPAPQVQEFNYPLGDRTFAIFKDAAGKYVTRYVSLRDGSVTYEPAPSLIKATSPTTAGVSIVA